MKEILFLQKMNSENISVTTNSVRLYTYCLSGEGGLFQTKISNDKVRYFGSDYR